VNTDFILILFKIELDLILLLKMTSKSFQTYHNKICCLIRTVIEQLTNVSGHTLEMHISKCEISIFKISHQLKIRQIYRNRYKFHLIN